MSRKYLLALVALLGACSSQKDPPQCTDSRSCVNNPKCQCWCSVKCGYRDKHAGDNPIWIDEDPRGIHCYCKRWDYEHFDTNCVSPNPMKEPDGAK
jgi:hypothetical protein